MTSPDAIAFCSRCGGALAGSAVCPGCGQVVARDSQPGTAGPAQTAAAAAQVLSEIGRFRILGTLGSGGFATVYRAEDVELGRQVAIKLLHPHLTADPDFIRRFHEEARAAARLRHRNIVRIYDASQTEAGRPYLVMELLEGTLLSQCIAQQAPMSPPDAAPLISQIAAALDYLHDNGLIHRDLKPTNVMVDETGQATLLDFGVVRSLYEQSHLTMTGQLFGTPTYMAPEQATGGLLGPTADIYSLGIVTYEMFAGRPPFQGNTQRLLYSHVYEQPPLLTGLGDSISVALQRALEKDPSRRFQRAGQFAAALTGASGEATLVAPADFSSTAADAVPVPARETTLAGSVDGVPLAPAESLSSPQPETTLAAATNGLPLVPVETSGIPQPEATLAGAANDATLAPVEPNNSPQHESTLASLTDVTPIVPANPLPAEQHETTLAAAIDAAPLVPIGPADGSTLAVQTNSTPLSAPPSDAAIIAPPPSDVAGGPLPSRAEPLRPVSAATEPSGTGFPQVGAQKPNSMRLVAIIGGIVVLLIAIAVGTILVSKRRSPPKRAAAPAVQSTVAPGSAAVSATPSGATQGAAPPAAGAQPAVGEITLRVIAPADGSTVNSAVVVKAEQTGATIKPATDNDPNAAHYHYFIDRDPASVLRPGQPIPSGQPDIVHSADASLTVSDLKPGQHSVWVVLAHTDHSPYSPNIQSKVGFTVVPVAESVQTLAGSGSQGVADGAASSAQFKDPSGVAVDSSGNVFVADAGNSRVRKISAGGAVATVAGSGAGQLDGPRGVAVDKSGNVYVADTGNNRIRKITPDGTVTTFAGSDSPGLGGGGTADGQGSAAQFRLPVGITVDGGGNLYVADTGNNRIRKITPAGVVSTMAGSGATGSGGFADGPGTSARFNAPRGIAVDASGNVYVADTLNQRIRKITPAGVVSTIAGSGDQGTANGAASAARFSNPDGIAVDAGGNLYVSDNSSFRIRQISLAGTVIDVAGTAREGFADGAAASAQFDFPAGLAVDASGNIYVADSNNHRIRKITPFKSR